MTEKNYNNGNKRIAKNTLVIYGQLMLRMFLGLYTSRLALEALGVSDYGLYNVVAGVVVLFTFLSNSLSGTTVRFINVERGKPDGDLNRVFNVCNVLHIAMAIFLFVLLELCGVYYIHHYLNVDPGKESDAMFVFQVSTVMCCLGVINVPFSSLFNATEKFLFTATVTISVKFVQLIFLYLLLSYDGNRLKFFAFIETMTTLISFIVYHFYAYRRWPTIIKWRFFKGIHFYKEMLLYCFYSLLSTLALMARGQGCVLLINYFWGTVVNGAFAVARNVERNVWSFVNNFQSAAAPQLTQSYSSGNTDRVFYLTSRVGKYCMLMMMLAFFPLWAELDFILHLWLVKVPDGALVFCQMILLMVFVAASDGGIWQVVNASGKVGKFNTIYSTLILLCIPAGFIILKYGSPAYMLLVVFLVADIFWRLIQLYMMHAILAFPIRRFCRSTYFYVIRSCLPVIICLYFTSQIQLESRLWHISHFIIILFLTMISVYYFGLKKSERGKIMLYIFRKVRSNE